MKAILWLALIDILLLILIAALEGCAHPIKPEAKPTVHLAWTGVHKYADQWTAHVIEEVEKSSLPKQAPKDLAGLCPGLQPSERVEFYAQLLSIMAKRESGFKPETKFKESFKGPDGKYVISRGLLQISQSSANSYGCDIDPADELHDPFVNLTCAVRILERWVQRDQMAMGVSGKNVGCGRYWSVCRASSGSYLKVRDYIRSLAICKP